MAKKRKTSKARKSPKAGLRFAGHGYDYGLLPRAMGIGAIQFPELFRNAGVVGLAHGFAPYEPIRTALPELTLVGTHPAPLKDAFSQLETWIKATDSRAVQLSIIFQNDGGYILALSQDPWATYQRTLGFDRTLSPILISATWCKRFDTTSAFIRDLAAHFDQFVSPFYLNAALASGAGVLTSPTPPPLMRIDGLQPLLLFSMRFLNEGDVPPNTREAACLTTRSASRSGSGEAETKNVKKTLEEIAADRSLALRTHFPVTLRRLSSDRFQAVSQELSNRGVKDWQIKQAACNISLSASMGVGPHFSGIKAPRLNDTIVDALRQQYEQADSNTSLLDQWTTQSAARQLLLDGAALLRYLGRSSGARGLEQLLQELTTRGALDDKAQLP
jgi:hypothetical protein